MRGAEWEYWLPSRLRGTGALIQAVSYRKYTVELWAEDPRLPTILLKALLADRDTGKPGVFRFTWTLPPRYEYAELPDQSEIEQFYKWFFHAIVMDMERHEAQEFFMVNGVRMYDPHAVVPPRPAIYAMQPTALL